MGKYNNSSSKKKNNIWDNPIGHAPYNFIPFNENDISVNESRMRTRSKLDKELMSGEIKYTITAKTPIFIDNGIDDSKDGDNHGFMKNEYGDYIIPGSSLRGLIRSNVQILGLSGFDEDIDDYSLMYRVVGVSTDLSRKYDEILGVDNKNEETRGLARNVQAGFITNINGEYKYFIPDRKFANGANYLMLSARRITEHKDDYPFFIKDWKKHFMYTGDCEFVKSETFYYKKDEKSQDRGELYLYKHRHKCDKNIADVIDEKGKFSIECEKRGRKVFVTKIAKAGVLDETVSVKMKEGKPNVTIDYLPNKGGENNDYIPYYEKVYYKLGGDNKTVIAVEDRVGNIDKPGFEKGHVISTGYIYKKKNIYIIPDDARMFENIIEDDCIKSFKVDYNSRKNTLHGAIDDKDTIEKIERFYDLPKEGEIKPAFFIVTGGKKYLGFTPRLRIFYDHKVKEGLKQSGEEVKYDYAKSIFGTKGFKSKVSFSDAKVIGEAKTYSERAFILASPKPTSNMDYIEQNNSSRMTTYNDGGFKLRGVKQYWLRDSIYYPEGEIKTKMESGFNPLPAGTSFKGIIRFNSLSRAELGLLIWAIFIKEDSCQNIGKGKPYGFGMINIDISSVRVFNNQKAYLDREGLSFNPFTEYSVETAISDYKMEINEKLQDITIDEVESVKTLIAMKTIKPNPNKINYMNLEEYKKRGPLESAMAVLGMEGKSSSSGKNQSKSNDSQGKSAVFTSELAESAPKKSSLKPDKGKEYTATVTEIKAGKLGFRVDLNAARFYGKIKLGKKERDAAASAYPVGSQITVIFNKVNEEDKPIWEVLK